MKHNNLGRSHPSNVDISPINYENCFKKCPIKIEQNRRHNIYLKNTSDYGPEWKQQEPDWNLKMQLALLITNKAICWWVVQDSNLWPIG